jgi:hypothetical protein
MVRPTLSHICILPTVSKALVHSCCPLLAPQAPADAPTEPVCQCSEGYGNYGCDVPVTRVRDGDNVTISRLAGGAWKWFMVTVRGCWSEGVRGRHLTCCIMFSVTLCSSRIPGRSLLQPPSIRPGWLTD